MKLKSIYTNNWFIILMVPAVIISMSILLTMTEMPSSQYLQAIAWGLGLVLLALAVNIDNRSAMPLLVLGAALPILALVSLLVPVALLPISGFLAIGWIPLSKYQINWLTVQSNPGKQADSAQILHLQEENLNRNSQSEVGSQAEFLSKLAG